MATASSKIDVEHLWVDLNETKYIQCAVCTRKANGFHYGVDTCGACKVGVSVHVIIEYRIYFEICIIQSFAETVCDG